MDPTQQRKRRPQARSSVPAGRPRSQDAAADCREWRQVGAVVVRGLLFVGNLSLPLHMPLQTRHNANLSKGRSLGKADCFAAEC